MDKGIEALIARKGNAVTGNYYLAECGNCSEMFPSERMTGGEVLYAGDYGDCYCPHCGAADCDISDYGDILSDAGLAWNYQQKHIDALIAALEQVQQECQAIEQKLIKAAVYIETLESEPRKTNLKQLNEIAGLKRKCVELPENVIDEVCLAAAEIHNLGCGVDDNKAQFIIERIRMYLSNGGTVEGSE